MRKSQQNLVMMPERFRSARIPLFQIVEDLSLYKPASFVQRWYALTLDLAFLGPLNVLVGMPFVRYLEHLEAYGQNSRLLVLSLILKILPIIIYVVIPTWITGQTLGKRIVGIKVVRSDYSLPLSLSQVVVRETLGKLSLVLTLGLGLMSMFSSKRRRGLHDRLSQTLVIDIS
ncbi:MAG: hypothetical protein RL011_170 [Pseudomonadota bacterium]|jgi:uncharacterized RDD family membrane protein YckC